jgi:plasmid stabilization system protein ParE
VNPVVIDQDAQDEIDNALTVSQDPARLRAAISDALALIQANPQIGARVGRRQGRQYILTNRLPYSIVYVEEPNQIRVVAFPHTSRKPGYWKNRLPKN